MAFKWVKQAEGFLERLDQNAKTVSGRERDAQPGSGTEPNRVFPSTRDQPQEGKLRAEVQTDGCATSQLFKQSSGPAAGTTPPRARRAQTDDQAPLGRASASPQAQVGSAMLPCLQTAQHPLMTTKSRCSGQRWPGIRRPLHCPHRLQDPEQCLHTIPASKQPWMRLPGHLPPQLCGTRHHHRCLQPRHPTQQVPTPA